MKKNTYLMFFQYKKLKLSRSLEFIAAFFKVQQVINTGKSLSEALIFASTNPQYEDRFFIELQVP